MNEGTHETTEKIKESEKDLKESLKKVVEGGLELLKSPTFFAMQNNPNYWKNVNEDVYTMMDFVQLGVPEEYLSQLPVDLQKRIKVLFEKLPQLPKQIRKEDDLIKRQSLRMQTLSFFILQIQLFIIIRNRDS